MQKGGWEGGVRRRGGEGGGRGRKKWGGKGWGGEGRGGEGRRGVRGIERKSLSWEKLIILLQPPEPISNAATGVAF